MFLTIFQRRARGVVFRDTLCVGQSSMSFSSSSFLHTIEHSSIPAQKVRNCPARDTSRATWLACQLFLCKKLWWTCV